jgi:hypothetical protein
MGTFWETVPLLKRKFRYGMLMRSVSSDWESFKDGYWGRPSLSTGAKGDPPLD